MVQTQPQNSRLLKCWGDEAVVYDTASGDTHYLKPLTLALYQACLDHPGATAIELVNMLATQLGYADTPELLELTKDTLKQLQKINLLVTA